MLYALFGNPFESPFIYHTENNKDFGFEEIEVVLELKKNNVSLFKLFKFKNV